jgi:hypothetical protein
MFPTPMDTNPIPPSVEPSTLQPIADSAPLNSPAPAMLAGFAENRHFAKFSPDPTAWMPEPAG